MSRTPPRLPGSAGTAATFIVLVTVTSAVAMVSAPLAGGADGRARSCEAKVVRAMAAVVAAVARDMLGGDVTAAALPAWPGSVPWPPAAPSPAAAGRLPVTVAAPLLAERLLDLPPPRA